MGAHYFTEKNNVRRRSNRSISYGGALDLKAKTTQLREHYMKAYGAIPFSRFDPLLLLIDGEAARELLGQYLKEDGQMQSSEYLELDALAAPNGYVAPPAQENLAYVGHFRKTCQRYQIDFAKADQDERNFVIHMAEKFFSKSVCDVDCGFCVLQSNAFIDCVVERQTKILD